MDTKHIHISDYNYPLPDDRIAKFPIDRRDHSKLLIYNRGEVSEDKFYNLHDYLPKGSLMVFNNTRVIQARIHFRKETGALIEVFCWNRQLRQIMSKCFKPPHGANGCAWSAILRNGKAVACCACST